jgi:hypothetical protein
MIIEERKAAPVEDIAPQAVEETTPAAPVEETSPTDAAGEPSPVPPLEEPPAEEPPVTEPVDPTPEEEPPVPLPETDPEPPPPDPDPEPSGPPIGEPEPVMEAALSDAPVEAVVRAPEEIEELRAEPEGVEPGTAEAAAPPPPRPAGPVLQTHWLLSLFTPAEADAVDWGRGSYTVLARGGRVDSPSGSGELKKQIQMVAEGSVLCVDGVPRGAAADVAPDGFAHPVFRAGFALSIRLPEVH